MSDPLNANSPPTRRDWDRIVIPVALITILAVAITLGIMRWIASKNSADQKQQADTAITVLQQLLEQNSSQVHLLQSQLTATTQPSLAGFQSVQLTGSIPSKALFFFDPDSFQWFVLAENLNPPITGYTLRVWITSNQTTLSASSLPVNDLHSAIATGQLTAAPNAPLTCFITTESSAASNTPTGPTLLKGTIP